MSFKPWKEIPKSVVIGGYVYRVVLKDDSDMPDNLGECRFNRHELWICRSQSVQSLANTFIHEVLHAINGDRGLDDSSTEEQFTTQDASGLCAFARHNPTAFIWWFRTNAITQ
jgi:hypothetical protein